MTFEDVKFVAILNQLCGRVLNFKVSVFLLQTDFIPDMEEG